VRVWHMLKGSVMDRTAAVMDTSVRMERGESGFLVRDGRRGLGSRAGSPTLDNQLPPQWSAWPLIAIVNSDVEIERRVSELRKDYAGSTVVSIFATFSAFLNAGADHPGRSVRRDPRDFRRLCAGECLVAPPVRALLAAMRLCDAAWVDSRWAWETFTPAPGGANWRVRGGMSTTS
jgi:hypothetical protein